MKKKVEENKIDVETYWNKKKFNFNWSKIFVTFIYVSFIVLIGVYGVDYYIKSHDLTFIKFKINPEFGFVVDGKDKVVYYISLNDDAKSIYNLDMFKGKSRSDALAKAIDVAKENNFLVDGEEKSVTVTVVSDEEDKVDELEKKVNDEIKKTDKEIQSSFEEATKEEVEQRFSSLVTAFKYGCPPHGGMAPGIDRILMLIQDEPNLREVQAFPTSASGADLMMGSPSKLEDIQLKELGIKLEVEEDE